MQQCISLIMIYDLKLFFINISKNLDIAQRLVECWHSIGPHVVAVGPALGGQSVVNGVPQSFSFAHQLAAARL